jgi:hypothetical protein
MSREAGFTTADIDTAKYHDAKVAALWRNVHDEAVMARALIVHDATVLASWGAGERVTAEDAAPLWMADIAEAVAALVAVHLLDDAHKVPLRAWKSYFGVAKDRREHKREGDRLRQMRSRAAMQTETERLETQSPMKKVYNPNGSERLETGTNVTRESRMSHDRPTGPAGPAGPTGPAGPSTRAAAREKTGSKNLEKNGSDLQPVGELLAAGLSLKDGKWVAKGADEAKP